MISLLDNLFYLFKDLPMITTQVHNLVNIIVIFMQVISYENNTQFLKPNRITIIFINCLYVFEFEIFKIAICILNKFDKKLNIFFFDFIYF